MKNRKLTKTFIALLTVVLSSNVIPVSVFASDLTNKTNSSTSYNSIDIDVYNKELKAIGLDDNDIEELREIGEKIATANSMREVDNLMKDFHRIMDNTPLAAGTSFSSKIGGTLTLDYTGKLSPISNVIYTKVVYMSNKQVELYQKAMNSPTFVTFIKNQLIGQGISVITKSVSKQIAAALGVSASSVSWLVGTSVAGLLFICQNLETWDLNDAIDRSSNGKVKLEYFYSTSISYPYYQEYENFEPWDNNRIDVPKDYNYDWQSGVYECKKLS